MSVQPAERAEFPYPVIHGDAVIVPIEELRKVRAIARHATPEVIAAARAEEDEIEASIARHKAWIAAGRPGEEDHEDVKRELLAELGL
jgi:2-methylisocitrate lyase-like PEP mutase family enzyme